LALVNVHVEKILILICKVLYVDSMILVTITIIILLLFYFSMKSYILLYNIKMLSLNTVKNSVFVIFENINKRCLVAFPLQTCDKTRKTELIKCFLCKVILPNYSEWSKKNERKDM